MKTRIHNGTLAEIEIYARRHFPDLSVAEHALYFDALRILEQKNGGLFKPVAVPEDVWARESGASRPTVRKGLGSLHTRGLIRRNTGSNGSDGAKRKVAIVRRFTVEEISRGISTEILNRFIPVDIEELARVLQERGTPWDGGIIRPRWAVTLTGRLTHSASPMTVSRTNTKPYRLKALRRNLAPDEVLIEADWRAAEPTVLCHALNTRGLLPPGVAPEAIYGSLQKSFAGNRDTAKREFQRLIYSPCRVLSVPTDWNLPAKHFLLKLVESVNVYREDLWKHGEPHGKAAPRCVHTLTGRKIVHDRKRRVNRGNVLSWQLQGTVADVFANVVKQVLQDDAEKLCRFFLPCHDAVYVARKRESDYDPAAVMQRCAVEAGIPLQAVTKTHLPL